MQWILVDGEHGAIGDTEMHNMIPAISGTGCSPIVRVAGPENFLVKRALDAGAHGIMFPMVETKVSLKKQGLQTCRLYRAYLASCGAQEQAEAVVRMCKFPPMGMRGCGSPFAPAYFGQSLTGYQDTANEATLVLVQIETPLGLKNAAAIASVPGIGQCAKDVVAIQRSFVQATCKILTFCVFFPIVHCVFADMLFIGPNDLACSMGNGSKNHMDCPEVQEAIEQIRLAAESQDKLAGIFCISAEQAAARFKQGFQFINVGADISAVAGWSRLPIATANEH